jgi:hypothetical protein
MKMKKPFILLAVLMTAGVSAAPWEVVFGGCTFSGDAVGCEKFPNTCVGSAVVRTGSCPTQGGSLDLGLRGITWVPAGTFEGMAQMT